MALNRVAGSDEKWSNSVSRRQSCASSTEDPIPWNSKISSLGCVGAVDLLSSVQPSARPYAPPAIASPAKCVWATSIKGSPGKPAYFFHLESSREVFAKKEDSSCLWTWHGEDRPGGLNAVFGFDSDLSLLLCKVKGLTSEITLGPFQL